LQTQKQSLSNSKSILSSFDFPEFWVGFSLERTKKLNLDCRNAAFQSFKILSFKIPSSILGTIMPKSVSSFLEAYKIAGLNKNIQNPLISKIAQKFRSKWEKSSDQNGKKGRELK